MTGNSGSRLMMPPIAYPPFHFGSSLSASASPYSHPTMHSSLSTSGSIPSTRAASPAFSDMSYSSQASRQSKRARRSDSSLSQQAPFPGYEPGWSKGEQAMFETSIARLTASAGLPLRWVENPEWLALCERFMPNAKSPSRKVLTQRLIPATLKTFKQTAQEQCRGLEGTVSYDGWTGGNHHHYIAFMVNCRGRVSLTNIPLSMNTAHNIGGRTMLSEFMTHRENERRQIIFSTSLRRLLMTWNKTGILSLLLSLQMLEVRHSKHGNWHAESICILLCRTVLVIRYVNLK
jgi:hypothetical protein